MKKWNKNIKKKFQKTMYMKNLCTHTSHLFWCKQKKTFCEMYERYVCARIFFFHHHQHHCVCVCMCFFLVVFKQILIMFFFSLSRVCSFSIFFHYLSIYLSTMIENNKRTNEQKIFFCVSEWMNEWMFCAHHINVFFSFFFVFFCQNK